MRRFLTPALLASALLAWAAPISGAPLQDAAKAGDVERARQLIDEGADLNARAGFGTALHWAIVNGHDGVATLLVARGADVNVSTTALGTPLHAAAKTGNAPVAALLLEYGANVDAQHGGFTPLHVAAERGAVEVIRLLLDHGADANALAEASGAGAFAAMPPLHLAERGGHAEAARLLREAGARPPPIEPIGLLMAAASAERGRALAVTMRCGLCHVLEPGQPPPAGAPLGPKLSGVVNRPVASLPGYDYTPALRRLGGTWSEERLYAFVSRPMVTAPGTRMDTGARGEPQQRADLIAYLKTLKNTAP